MSEVTRVTNKRLRPLASTARVAHRCAPAPVEVHIARGISAEIRRIVRLSGGNARPSASISQCATGGWVGCVVFVIDAPWEDATPSEIANGVAWRVASTGPESSELACAWALQDALAEVQS